MLLALLSLGLSSCGNDKSASTTPEPQSLAETPNYEEGFVQASDGVELYYRKRGNEGRTVIVPSRLFNWDELNFLGNHFTYISYDMRNRGRSSKVSDGELLTLEKDVDDLEAVRRYFGIEWFSTIGYSYLGKVVIMYAREHPVRIDRVVQVGPVPPVFSTEYPEELTAASLPSPFPEGEVERLTALRDEGVKESDPKRYCEVFWEIIPYQLVGDAANVDKINADYCDMENEWPVNIDFHMEHAFTNSAMNHVLSDEEIEEVEVPVLTIHGTRDRNAPYGAGREWAMKLPDARLITIEGAGHHVWADDPAINEAILTFLQGEWPERAEVVTTLLP
jgi:pimeloyl-ACP methyl ester carboxylesterase